MSEATTGAQLVGMVVAISETIEAHKDELNRLDAALGDGDHGTGLSAGFVAAAGQAQALENPPPSEVVRVTAMALMNTMGGSSGALYGTFFLEASMVCQGKDTLSGDDWAAMLQAGLDGVMERGKAKPGGKTMVDALYPAVGAFSQAIQGRHSLSKAFESAARAAEEGAYATAGMVAQFGRAKFTGERAVGHRDAGAVSMALIIRELSVIAPLTGSY